MAGKASTKSSLARRYAVAVFALAQEDNALKEVQQELDGISRMIAENPELEKALNSPIVARAEIANAFAEIIKNEKISKLTGQFIKLLGRGGRLFLLPEIAHAFDEMAAEHKGELTAEITSTTKLKKEQKDALAKALKKATSRKVNIKERLDQNILGGLIVKIGSNMLDSSIRARLARMERLQKQAKL